MFFRFDLPSGQIPPERLLRGGGCSRHRFDAWRILSSSARRGGCDVQMRGACNQFGGGTALNKRNGLAMCLRAQKKIPCF